MSTSVQKSTKAAARTPRAESWHQTLKALPWLSPVLVLILGIVAFPTGVMIYNSTRKITQSGLVKGSVGWKNYEKIFSLDYLPKVLANTAIWVASVVIITLVLSLLLAQLLNKEFPGRQIVRMSVIIPWAASVIMSTTVFYYALEPRLGIVNHWLHSLGITDSDQVGFTKTASTAFMVAIFVAVYVSLPFTTYTILAGLQAIPRDVLEAAAVDGAGRMRTYFSVVLPQLRSAIAAATIINIINVFNSLPILKVITGPVPGHDADTTTTLIFKIIQGSRRLDWASALSVINFGLVLLVIAVYLMVVRPMKQVED